MTATAAYQNIARLLVVLFVGTLAVLAVVTTVAVATHHSSTATHSLAGGRCRGCD